MHLPEIQQADEVLSLAELIIDEDICINLRGRMMHCTQCADTCPADALTLTPDAIDLDSEKCNHCTSCLPSCAAGALRSGGFVPERFLQALKGKKEAHIHCRGSRDGGGGIVIPCHGVLDNRLFLAAGAEGIEKIYLHGLTQCIGCNLGDARDQIKQEIKTTLQFLGGQAPRFDLAPGESGEASSKRDHHDQRHLSRRSFLRFSGANAIHHAADWIVPGLAQDDEDEDDILPFYQAEEMPQRPSQYAQALVARADKLVWDSGSYPWRSRRVTEDCSGCLSCGQRCPTGALVAVETNDKRELSFDPGLCTDCKLCEQICPENSIVSSMVSGADSITEGRILLFHLRQVQCRVCGTPFIPGEEISEYCLVCRNEQDIDDDWLDMLSG